MGRSLLHSEEMEAGEFKNYLLPRLSSIEAS